MPTNTTNYNLVKIELSDTPPDITKINPNWDTIDEKLFKKLNGDTALAENTDLNTVLTPGRYFVGNNEAVATLQNCPTSEAFHMYVGQHAGVYQRLIEYKTENPKIFFRNYYAHDSTWGEWIRELTSVDGGGTFVGESQNGQSLEPIKGHTVVAGTGTERFNDYRVRTYNSLNAPQQGNIATGDYSHSEGSITTAYGNYSHAEGYSTIASGVSAHAEGYSTKAVGFYSHAEGRETVSNDISSHAEGNTTTASGHSAHAEGNNTYAIGNVSHAEGLQTIANGNYSHSEGRSRVAYGNNSHAEGSQDAYISKEVGITTLSDSKELKIVATNDEHQVTENPVSEIQVGCVLNLLNEFYQVVTVSGTTVRFDRAVSISAMPGGTIENIKIYQYGAIGASSHVEGYNTMARVEYAHAEGNTTTASGQSAHAEGYSTTAYGHSSHAEGSSAIANGDYSHAEGSQTTASGAASHAEGDDTSASGDNSHAEGFGSVASGSASHAEGDDTVATKIGSHSEGSQTTASGDSSHAEGKSSTASGESSHAEGHTTSANGDYSHAEGSLTIALGNSSHAEGSGSQANGDMSHAEGLQTIASAHYSHAEGNQSKASGESSHAEGEGTVANGIRSHAEGRDSATYGDSSHAEGIKTIAGNAENTTVQGAHAEGYMTKAVASYSHAEGNQSQATGMCSHAEGNDTKATGVSSHAEGYSTTASGDYSHAEGEETTASGGTSHAEGQETTASAAWSHAEGYSSDASGMAAHAEGGHTQASNNWAHAEGSITKAQGLGSHAEGTNSVAYGSSSHAEGAETYANGRYSHAGGFCTYSGNYQLVHGRYNKHSDGPTSDSDMTGDIFIIGNGTGSDEQSSNALRTTTAGKTYGLDAFSGSGADYAEYFEWEDGNPDNEQRYGLFVTLDGEKIKLATSEDDYILGIVSAKPVIEGDSQSEQWKNKYLKDVFGNHLTETEEVAESVDEETGETIPAHTVTKWVLNPEYDPEQTYIRREDRPEWSAVGLVGKLVVVDDGTCVVNGYCKAGTNGIGTNSETRENAYRVIARLDETHVKVLVR